MTALTADRDPRRKERKLGAGKAGASQLLYGGAALMFNSSGYVIEGADTASCVFAGICNNQVDNSSGSNGDKDVEFWRDGLFLFNMDTAISQSDVGSKAYLVDDQTADVVANVSNNIFCGVIAEYVTSALAWIDITPATAQTDVASHLSDSSDAHDASAISIADSGGYTDQTTVEAALQEMFPFIATVISDPGDAGAIPVTRSGVCALTTGATGETRTIADPDQAGLELTVTLDVDGGGDAVVTVATAFNDTGNNTITLANAGDTITLTATQIAGSPVWRLIENDGAALSTV